MSCFNKDIKYLDTTVYSRFNDSCESIKSHLCQKCHCCCPCPYPPFPPPTPVVPEKAPTTSFALFSNNLTVATPYTAGSIIPFSNVIYDTDFNGIRNANGIVTLSGGEDGRSYLINYQATGNFAEDTSLGLVINGVTDANSQVSANTENLNSATASGSYIVSVPANTNTTVSLNVIEGTYTLEAPSIGTNFSVIRIA